MIIGLTGKMAAGKGTVAEYLKKQGFAYYYFSEVIREEVRLRNMEETIPNLIEFGNELRTKGGSGVLGKKILAKIQQNKDINAIADGIRNPAEIEELKKSDDKFLLIAVDAPLEVRYQRMKDRKRVDDTMTLTEFTENDFKQLKSADPNAQQVLECFKMANYVIVNDGSLEELHQKIEDILKEFK